MSIDSRRALKGLVVAVCAFVVLCVTREAGAVPAFARKYATSCTACHTVYPALNPVGEAFRRNGYRFPSTVKESNASKLSLVPLGLMVNGGVTANLPGSDAKTAAGNTFNWNGIVSELHIFGAGSFSEDVTYFTQITAADGGVDIETAYLLWNDVAGPQHALNLWIGRLMSPSLNSWGLHSSYLADTFAPPTAISALFNPTGSFTLGQGHNDGVEANGVLAHRIGWSVGWLASGSVTGLKAPNAEDVYAHLGVKLGGMSLDGEGEDGAQNVDKERPWEETSLTLDAFGYHGKSVLDSGTGVGSLIAQNDKVTAFGGDLRLSLGSFLLSAGAQYEKHSSPFQGTPGTPASPPTQPADVPGTPDTTSAHSLVAFGEANYIVAPWFVPGVRVESTHVTRDDTSTSASVLRIVPGAAFVVKSNIKLVVTASIEQAKGQPFANDWSVAGATINPDAGTTRSLRAETLNATVSLAY